VGSRGSSPIDRLAGVGLSRPDPDNGDPHVLADSHLHSDTDEICPRCLQWIEERDFVRRTAYGVLQHEVCPQHR
jgi:hypothetical protein